jgi:CDGSH-type Zn-finger protein
MSEELPKPRIAGTTPVTVELEARKAYYFCTCGLSEKQPFCDGKHKGTGFKSRGFSMLQDSKVSLCLCKQSDKSPFCDGSHKKL